MSWVVVPAEIVTVAGLTVIEVSVGAVTVTEVVPLIPFTLAVIVV